MAEQDDARAWSARWKAVAKRLWVGIHRSLDQSELLAARMLKAEAERDALAARLAAAEAVEKVLRDGLRDLRGYSVSNWFLVDSTLAFAEKAALAGSREQPQGEEA